MFAGEAEQLNAMAMMEHTGEQVGHKRDVWHHPKDILIIFWSHLDKHRPILFVDNADKALLPS
jgi:hypothetical protein